MYKSKSNCSCVFLKTNGDRNKLYFVRRLQKLEKWKLFKEDKQLNELTISIRIKLKIILLGILNLKMKDTFDLTTFVKVKLNRCNTRMKKKFAFFTKIEYNNQN